MDLQYFHDQGERDENLDLFFCFSTGPTGNALFLVLADGYGDSSEEDLSHYLQNICHELIKNHQEHTLSYVLKSTPPEKSRASVLVAKISGNELEICSIGDCRAYINNLLITTDDSLAWRNLFNRKPSEDVARLVAIHPLRHKLTDSMTPQRRKDITTLKMGVYDGDHLVFCTDGIWPIFHEDICSGSFNVKDINIKLEDNSLALSIIL